MTATPRTDELRRAYEDSLHDGIGEFMAELFASHEALEREAHRAALEQEPVGWLDWPSLTFRLNGVVSVRAPTSVVVQPIPLYAAPQPAPGMVMVPVPKELTAENGAKAALMGEFCFRFGEDTLNVPWTTIKEIHRAVVALFAQGDKP